MKLQHLFESYTEATDDVDTGPTWQDDLQDALDGYDEHQHDTIKDGTCPECSGSSYMDGDDENGEDSCTGMQNYACDEGEIRDNTWADELKQSAPKQPVPSEEQIKKILPRLHDEFVKTGRFNAFALSDILKQLYPEIAPRDASGYVADFLLNYKETTENTKDEVLPKCELCKGEGCDACGGTGEEDGYIHRDLGERAYKDVGVADTVKDQRGKEFKFDKTSKKFKSLDGEEADKSTKLGKDLMRIRNNQMKKSTPSYPRKDKLKASWHEEAELNNLRKRSGLEEKAPSHYDLEQAYFRIYQMTDEMGDEALEQMNEYAPKFSDALERAEGDIEDIPAEEIPTYMAELDNAAFEMGAPELESVQEAELNNLRKRAGLEEKEGDDCHICFGRGKIDAHSEDGPSKCQKCKGTGKEQWRPEPTKFKKATEKESFDPRGEPTMFDAAMEVYDDHGERGLSEYLGMSEQQFDQELNEWCAMHGKHADDDREEAIQGVVEEIIDNADMGAQMAQYEAKDITDLKRRAGIV